MTRGHPSRDVAVTCIAIATTNGMYQSGFVIGTASFGIVDANGQTGLFKDVLVGNEVYTFGYPSSIGLQEAPQLDQNRALIRRGIVADKDPNRRTLVLDSPAFKGNSGGPIIARSELKAVPNGIGLEYKVVGIVVEFVPFEERWVNSQFGYWNTTISNSGYSIGEPMDSIFETLW